MKKFLFISCIFFSFVSCAQTDSLPSFVKDSLDSYVNNALGNWQVPGAAVCIVKNGKVVLMKGYGVKELNGTDKVDENTLFTAHVAQAGIRGDYSFQTS